MASLSPPVRLATSALFIGAAIAAGYGLGSRFGKAQPAALGGAAVLGVAGGAAAYALNACVPDVAAVDLHNYAAGHDDPRAVKKDDIERIAKKSVCDELSDKIKFLYVVSVGGDIFSVI